MRGLPGFHTIPTYANPTTNSLILGGRGPDHLPPQKAGCRRMHPGRQNCREIAYAGRYVGVSHLMGHRRTARGYLREIAGVCGGSRIRRPSGTSEKGRDSGESRPAFRDSARSLRIWDEREGFCAPRICGRLRRNICAAPWAFSAGRGSAAQSVLRRRGAIQGNSDRSAEIPRPPARAHTRLLRLKWWAFPPRESVV